jgi:hypothetical protein
MASRQKNGGGAFVGAGLYLWHFVSSSKIRETHPLDQGLGLILLRKNMSIHCGYKLQFNFVFLPLTLIVVLKFPPSKHKFHNKCMYETLNPNQLQYIILLLKGWSRLVLINVILQELQIASN